MIAGLLKEIDKDMFEVVLFNVGQVDSKTAILESYASRHVRMADLDFEGMKRKLSQEKLDVAVYAEIGMDPHSYALALGRQAPVQIVMHGHASTTGIDTLDYFVTYEGFSEPDAQSHYSEALIELPGQTPLTLYYHIVPFKVHVMSISHDSRLIFPSIGQLYHDSRMSCCLHSCYSLHRHTEVSIVVSTAATKV